MNPEQGGLNMANDRFEKVYSRVFDSPGEYPY